MQVTKEFVKNNKGNRFNVYYEDGTKKNNIAFFIYEGMVCYLPSRNKRKGKLFNEYRSPSIIKIEKVLPKTYDVKDNINKFLKKIHTNVWDNLVSKYGNILSGNESMERVEEFLIGKVKYRRDIKKVIR